MTREQFVERVVRFAGTQRTPEATRFAQQVWDEMHAFPAWRHQSTAGNQHSDQQVA